MLQFSSCRRWFEVILRRIYIMLCHVSDPNLEGGADCFHPKWEVDSSYSWNVHGFQIRWRSCRSAGIGIEKQLGKPSQCCNESGKYCRWLQPMTKNIIGRVEAFRFSPANSYPCHQATSCHVILHHIMSYYVMYQTCFPISASVKGLLISSFTEWHGAYFLRQICMNSHASEGGGSKRFEPLLGSTYLESLWGGGIKDCFRHLAN